MKRVLRPAFIATALVGAGCIRTNNPPEPIETHNPPALDLSPEEKAAYRAQYGIHPQDNDHHMIFKKGDGSCYVQVPKSEPEPKDMLSGEKWVDDRPVPCPAEFDDPAFAAIGDQEYWVLDRTKNECFVGQAYGNPPLPPVQRECPPVVKKMLPEGTVFPPVSAPAPPAAKP